MSIYEYKYRTTLVVRHRKSGGYWTGLPKEMIDQLRVYEGCQMEIAVIRTESPASKDKLEAKEE